MPAAVAAPRAVVEEAAAVGIRAAPETRRLLAGDELGPLGCELADDGLPAGGERRRRDDEPALALGELQAHRRREELVQVGELAGARGAAGGDGVEDEPERLPERRQPLQLLRRRVVRRRRPEAQQQRAQRGGVADDRRIGYEFEDGPAGVDERTRVTDD